MDDIDRAQARQQEEIEQALARRKPVEQGTTECTRYGCVEPINDLRRKMGATLCIHHQRLLEQGAKPWQVTSGGARSAR